MKNSISSDRDRFRKVANKITLHVRTKNANKRHLASETQLELNSENSGSTTSKNGSSHSGSASPESSQVGSNSTASNSPEDPLDSHFQNELENISEGTSNSVEGEGSHSHSHSHSQSHSHSHSQSQSHSQEMPLLEINQDDVHQSEVKFEPNLDIESRSSFDALASHKSSNASGSKTNIQSTVNAEPFTEIDLDKLTKQDADEDIEHRSNLFDHASHDQNSVSHSSEIDIKSLPSSEKNNLFSQQTSKASLSTAMKSNDSSHLNESPQKYLELGDLPLHKESEQTSHTSGISEHIANFHKTSEPSNLSGDSSEKSTIKVGDDQKITYDLPPQTEQQQVTNSNEPVRRIQIPVGGNESGNQPINVQIHVDMSNDGKTQSVQKPQIIRINKPQPVIAPSVVYPMMTGPEMVHPMGAYPMAVQGTHAQMIQSQTVQMTADCDDKNQPQGRRLVQRIENRGIVFV